ncbi:MAG TPA: hypothetical protein VMN38_00790 [Sphingomicrobium sp.]|nr:hypothetical protein [Sphingomicrobium sp.]
MEPWFGWSWLLGIKPVHPNGWAALGVWFLVAIPLMFGSVGAFGEQSAVQVLCAVAFVASAVVFFWLVFLKFQEPSE